MRTGKPFLLVHMISGKNKKLQDTWLVDIIWKLSEMDLKDRAFHFLFRVRIFPTSCTVLFGYRPIAIIKVVGEIWGGPNVRNAMEIGDRKG